MSSSLSRGLFLLAMPLFFTGCSQEESPPVGVLRTTTHEFTMHAGPEGTLYSIREIDGKEIVREISRQNLAAKFPELSEELRSLWAGNARTNAADGNLADPSSLDPVDAPAYFDEPAGRSPTFIKIPDRVEILRGQE